MSSRGSAPLTLLIFHDFSTLCRRRSHYLLGLFLRFHEQSYRDSQESNDQVTAEERVWRPSSSLSLKTLTQGRQSKSSPSHWALQQQETVFPNNLLHLQRRQWLGEKVFSKLKVIGDRLGQLDDETRREVNKGLPDSYSTIHLLCALKPDDWDSSQDKAGHTKHRSEQQDLRQTSPFPTSVARCRDVEKGRWSIKEETLYRVCRPEDTPLSEDLQRQLEEDLRKVCSRTGWTSRATNDSTTALRDADRKEKAAFWREVLEEQLPQKWFQETDKESEDLQRQGRRGGLGRTTHLHWFPNQTGRGNSTSMRFHGQAYVAKLHHLQETTESRTNRYNLKRRIEEVLAHKDSTKLVIWRNVVLKNSGLL